MKLLGAGVGFFALAVPGLGAASPMSYLRTFGPAGNPGMHLGWGLGIVSILVTLVITLLLLGAIFRRRTPAANSNELAVHCDAGGMSWLYVGVGISSVVLITCVVWTMFTVAAIAMPMRAGALTLQVTGAQWWWNVRYHNDDSSQIFDAPNEIHIPVGEPVRIELSSLDVIHSFWIPQLAGKTDVIPGQTNVMWLQADRAGSYRGQCGEFCGLQHAHMAMYVIAQDPKDYYNWTQAQLRETAAPVSESARHDQQVFLANCAACHTVRGTPAGGILGPDLTHVMSRKMIGAGLLANTPGNLSAWIADAQALKPGARMPSLTLSGEDLNAVARYVSTLR